MVWPFPRRPAPPPPGTAEAPPGAAAWRARLLDAMQAMAAPAALPGAEARLRAELLARPGLAAAAPGQDRRAGDLALLALFPDLAQVWLFHPDGRLREAALNALDGPLAAPAAAWGLGLRLNDWAPPVRLAAEAAFARCWPATGPEVLLPALWALLPRAARWGRRPQGHALLLRHVLDRQDLIDALARRLGDTAEGGTAGILRALCRSPSFDRHLPALARAARQPHLRAMALGFLGAGRVWWPSGRTTRVWTDRSMGRWRDEPEYVGRPLPPVPDLPALLEAALADPAALVRRRAAEVLTDRRREPAFRPLVARALAAGDRNPGVQARLAHLARVEAG